MEACSCNHFCSEKAICISYSECVFVALGIVLVRFIITCGLSSCILPHYLTNSTIFEKKSVLKTKYVFLPSLHLLCEMFLVLTRIQRGIIKIIYWSSCRVPVIIVRF